MKNGASTLKVLHVIETLGHGGAEQLLATLLPELKRQGADVEVAVRRGSMALRGVLEAAGVRVTVLPEMSKWSLIQSAREIAKIADAMKADVIHAHLYFPAVSTAVARIRSMTSAKTCVTFHNLAYAGANKKSLRLRGKSLLARYLYRRGICGFVAVSQAVGDHYTAALGMRDIRVVTNAIDVTQLDAVVPVPRGDDIRLNVVVPGRLVPEKGHDTFIEAVQGLPRDTPPFRVTFAGDGPCRAALDQSVDDAGFSEQVSFTGALDHQSFLSTIADADIVVVPSRFEGFGLVALEAMALGRPVISSTAGGLPEVIGDAGVLVPIDAPVPLRDALLSLLKDKDARKQLGTAGRARVKQRFEVATMAKSLLEFYHDMPAHPRGMYSSGKQK